MPISSGSGACDRHAAIDAKRREPALFSFLCFHDDRGRRAVGKLRSVAGGDELAFLDGHAALPDRLQTSEARPSVVPGRLPSSFSSVTFHVGDITSFFVLEFHHRRHAARSHRRTCRPAWAAWVRCCDCSAYSSWDSRANAVTLADDFRRLDHLHIGRRHVLEKPRVRRYEQYRSFWLVEIDSTPPPMTTSILSTITCFAAVAIAIMPDAH